MAGRGPEDVTRFGVRLRDAREVRRILVAAAVLFFANAITNRLFVETLDARWTLAHPGVYAWTAPVLTAFGLAAAITAAVVSDDGAVRIYPSAAVIGGLSGIALLFLFMWSAGYPFAGFQAISYSIIAMLAFYLLSRAAAVLAVVGLVVGHSWLELTAETAWPAWLTIGYTAVVLLMAGSLTGWLMEQLERSRNAERASAVELADLNANLEAKVAEQVGEVERLGRLRRFLSAPVAEAVLTSSDESRLAPHRREIAVLFCDLRGFTAFTRQVEPEEVIEVLDAYYAAAGAQITKFQATLGSFEGDGLMAYLNDPVPCDDPAERVVEMGLAMADAIDALTPGWQRRGYDLSYGIGMALGHATLGIVGYDGRNDYTALGTVVNLAARLCSAAGPRELIVDQRVMLQTEGSTRFTTRAPVALKGLGESVPNYMVDRT